MARAANLDAQVAKGTASTAFLLVRKHASHGSLEDHVRHTREKRPLPSVVQLVLLVVSFQHGSRASGNDGLFCVHDDDFVVTVFASGLQENVSGG